MPRKPIRSLSFIASELDSSNEAEDSDAFEDDYNDDDRYILLCFLSFITYTLFK